MPNDGDHPLSEALIDTAQKGAAMAAVVMQVLSERERMRQPNGQDPIGRALATAEVPGNGHPAQLPGRARQDYLQTKRGWAPAFELGFANSDPRTAVGVWIEATRHAELYPSAREALPFANERLRALDPVFMQQVERTIGAGAGPFEALETTARNQLQLPEGRSIEAKLAAAELELERVRQDYAAEYQEAWENDEISRGIGGMGVPAPSGVALARAEAQVEELEYKLSEAQEAITAAEIAGMGRDWHAEEDRYTVEAFHPNGLPAQDHPEHYASFAALAPAVDEAMQLREDGWTAQVTDNTEGLVIKGDELVDAWHRTLPQTQDPNRPLTAAEATVMFDAIDEARALRQGATAPEPGDLASAQARAQARALEGLSADETLAGQQAIGTAKDRPQTAHVDERVEGLTNSVERFQLAEGSHANAAHLVAASYPKSLESTMQATANTPIQPVSKPNVVPAKTHRRSL